MNHSTASSRRYSVADALIGRLDRLVRAVSPAAPSRARPSPADTHPETSLSPAERRHSAGLMRVNHTGEVCAQALYIGQNLVARDPELKRFLTAAALEEADHLHWCAERLAELGSHPSRLNPAWYAGSLVIAVAFAVGSDAISLGFVEETERQVCAHLDGHLEELSERDFRSRAIVAAMRADEARHADNARANGARELPAAAKCLMKMQARVMTRLAYWI